MATAGSTCATSPSMSTSSRRFAIRASSVVAVATPPAALARSSTACAFSDSSGERAALRLHVHAARHRAGDTRILQPGDVERRAEPSQVEVREAGPGPVADHAGRQGERADRAGADVAALDGRRVERHRRVESRAVERGVEGPRHVGRQAQARHRRRQAPDVDVVDAAGQIEADALLAWIARPDRAARIEPAAVGLAVGPLQPDARTVEAPVGLGAAGLVSGDAGVGARQRERPSRRQAAAGDRWREREHGVSGDAARHGGRVARDAGIDVRERERAAELDRPRRIVPPAADDDVADGVPGLRWKAIAVASFDSGPRTLALKLACTGRTGTHGISRAISSKANAPELTLNSRSEAALTPCMLPSTRRWLRGRSSPVLVIDMTSPCFSTVPTTRPMRSASIRQRHRDGPHLDALPRRPGRNRQRRVEILDAGRLARRQRLDGHAAVEDAQRVDGEDDGRRSRWLHRGFTRRAIVQPSGVCRATITGRSTSIESRTMCVRRSVSTR